MYDAIVSGLGPAGSTLARELAKGGLKVLGIDKARFPRYKSCGGCISTKIAGQLDFDISQVTEETILGATFTYRSDRQMDILSGQPLGYNVMRDRFDNLLLEKAKEAGAEILEGVRVTKVFQDSSCVTVACGNGKTYSAKFLAGADGSSGITGREFFKLNPRECAVSITAEVPYDRSRFKCSGKLYIDFGGVPFGYGWIFPKEKYLSVGLACDSDRINGSVKEYFDNFVNTHPALKGLDIYGAGQRAGWSVPIYYEGMPPMVNNRVVLAGDTGHLVDPFLGEGIYYAIRTAKAAASAIIESNRTSRPQDLLGYEQWLQKEIYPEFKAAGKLSDLVYNHPRLWYSILEKDPGIMLRYYDVIRGKEDSRSFYNWVFAKVSSKPWKMLRRWVESKFLPA